MSTGTDMLLIDFREADLASRGLDELVGHGVLDLGPGLQLHDDGDEESWGGQFPLFVGDLVEWDGGVLAPVPSGRHGRRLINPVRGTPRRNGLPRAY